MTKGIALKSRRIFTSDEGNADMSSDEFCTPPLIIDPLRELFAGGPDCDPCSNARSIVGAKVAYTVATPGSLSWRPWGGPKIGTGSGTVYANWPYSTNEPWAHKACLELRTERVSELVVLCMVATSTVWWRNLMNRPKRNPRVLATPRLKFIGVDGRVTRDTSRFDPALIYYGPRVKTFDRLFKHVARWATWGR